MNWTLDTVIGAVIAAALIVKKRGEIRPHEAIRILKEGALVVDVRTPGEFKSGHLAAAINIPLDELEIAVPKYAPRKNEAMLLHCQGGVRSGMAQRKLKQLGYTRVFNLGSYARAGKIVRKAAQPGNPI